MLPKKKKKSYISGSDARSLGPGVVLGVEQLPWGILNTMLTRFKDTLLFFPQMKAKHFLIRRGGDCDITNLCLHLIQRTICIHWESARHSLNKYGTCIPTLVQAGPISLVLPPLDQPYLMGEPLSGPLHRPRTQSRPLTSIKDSSLFWEGRVVFMVSTILFVTEGFQQRSWSVYACNLIHTHT